MSLLICTWCFFRKQEAILLLGAMAEVLFFFFSFSPFPCKGGLRSLGTSGHQQRAAQLPSAGNFLAPATQKPSSGGVVVPPPLPSPAYNFKMQQAARKGSRRERHLAPGVCGEPRTGSPAAPLPALLQGGCGGRCCCSPGVRGGSGGEQEAAASPPLPSPGPCRRCPLGL